MSLIKEMSLPKENPELDFSYFDAAKSNIHSFMTRAVCALREKIGDPSYSSIAVVNPALRDIKLYAAENKCKGFEFTSPVTDMSYLLEVVEQTQARVKETWSDCVYKFDNVYVMTLCHYHTEYEDMYCSFVSIILGKTKDAIHKFMDGYVQAKWQRNRQMPCVLGYGGQRMDNFRKMRWDDIYLPDNMVSQIRGEIETFFKNEKAYKEHGLDWKRGIMLAGKPGNGKTSLARAIATDSNVPCIYCMLDDGDMFRILERVGRTIQQNAPCIVIFEDADTLGSNPALRSAMLNMLDGLFSAAGVLTIASTNCPEKLDEAFTGRPSRFDSFYVIDDPPAAERLKILLARLGKNGKGLQKKALASLNRNMHGMSAACVQEIAVCALLESFKTKKAVTVVMLEAALEKMQRHLRNSVDGIDKTTRGAVGFAPKAEDEW